MDKINGELKFWKERRDLYSEKIMETENKIQTVKEMQLENTNDVPEKDLKKRLKYLRKDLRDFESKKNEIRETMNKIREKITLLGKRTQQ